MKVESMLCAPSAAKAARRNWTRGSLKHCAVICSTARPNMALAPNSGRSSGYDYSSNACLACHTAKCMSGALSVRLASATKSRIVARSSAMTSQWNSSSAKLGLRLKKSPKGGPHNRLCRRVGSERTSYAGAHLGAQGANPGHPVPFQLEALVGHCRAYPAVLPVPLSRRQHQEGRDRRVSQGAQSPPQAAAPDYLGWPQGAPVETGQGLPGRHRWSHPDCFPAAILARFESGRISVGLAQASCTGELLPGQSRRVADDCPQQTQKRPASPEYHRGLLEAGRFVLVS